MADGRGVQPTHSLDESHAASTLTSGVVATSDELQDVAHTARLAATGNGSTNAMATMTRSGSHHQSAESMADVASSSTRTPVSAPGEGPSDIFAWAAGGTCSDHCFSRTFVMPCHRSCPGGNFTLDGLMHGRLDLVTRW